MLEMVCFLPIQHSDRRRASIQDEDRAAFDIEVTKILS